MQDAQRGLLLIQLSDENFTYIISTLSAAVSSTISGMRVGSSVDEALKLT